MRTFTKFFHHKHSLLNVCLKRSISNDINISSLLTPHFAEILRKFEEVSKKVQIETDTLVLSRLGRDYNHLGRAVELIEKHSSCTKNIRDLAVLEYEEHQKGEVGMELASMARDELEVANKDLKEIEASLMKLLMPRDEADNRGAVLEIRAGTGGDEASLFAGELYQMYSKLAQLMGWHWDELTFSKTDVGGFKEAQACIKGEDVFRKLKFESGVHRVQRIPVNDIRIQTSAVSVIVLPEAEELDVEVKPGDVRVDVFRSGGAGGQSVNKTESAVRLTHIPTGIVVSMQDERSQIQNRAKAFKILRSRLFDLKRKLAQEARSGLRSAAQGTGDRSDKIRTYNFPQDRVTDHRVGVTIAGVQRVLAGEALEAILDPLSEQEEVQILQDFVNSLTTRPAPQR